jgi:hypothetical protein
MAGRRQGLASKFFWKKIANGAAAISLRRSRETFAMSVVGWSMGTRMVAVDSRALRAGAQGDCWMVDGRRGGVVGVSHARRSAALTARASAVP